MNEGDTIYAMRRGQVIEVEDGLAVEGDVYFKRNSNFVRIRHKDCSIGRYKNFNKEEIFVRQGQSIEIGDPIGIVGTGHENEIGKFFFSCYYYQVNAEVIQKGDRDAIYFPLTFITGEGQIREWDYNAHYTSILTEDIISQEMKKREWKKWKKQHQR